MPLTALTRPRISAGVRNCTSEKRITTLTTSAAPITASAASDRMRLVDSANTMIAAPKIATTANSTLPIGSVSGRRAKQHRHHQGADAGRRAQQPQPPRPGLQDVAREYREQRRRRGEEHRAHVERDGAEDHAVAPDEVEAAQQRLQAHRLARARHGSIWIRKMKLAPMHQNADRDAVDRSRTERVQQPAEDRADDHADLVGRRRTRRSPTAPPARGTSAGMIETMVGISNARPAPTSAMIDVDDQRIDDNPLRCRAPGCPRRTPRRAGRSAG